MNNRTRVSVSHKRYRIAPVVALVLLFGFALRSVDLGAAPLMGDEGWVSFLAFSEGHNGQRSELGMKTSTGLDHSPFIADVLSPAYAFDPDPRMARLYIAALQLLGMAMLYLLGRRYWSERVGMAALVIYAVIPRGVMAGRFLWNPYIVPPFLIAYFLTGFLILDGKRWARWLHPLCLALAVQGHPAVITLAPVSLIFYALDMRKRPGIGVHRRWPAIRDHAVGIALAALSMLPWLIGYVHLRAGVPVTNLASPSSLPLRLAGGTPAPTVLADFMGYQITADFTSLGGIASAYVKPDQLASSIGNLIGALTALSAVILIVWGLIGAWWRRQIGYIGYVRGAIVGIGYLLMPAFLLVLPLPTYSAYLIPLMPLGALCLAIILDMMEQVFWQTGRAARTAPRLRWIRTVTTLTILAISAFYLAITLNWLDQIHNFHNYTRDSQLSLDKMVSLRNIAVRPGYETLYLVDGNSAGDFVQEMVWLTLATKGPSRVLWGGQDTLPVPSAGATYVGYADSTFIPELYGLPKPRLTVNGVYRVVDLPPMSDKRFPPQCNPSGPTQLSNGVTILGYYTPGDVLPTPGNPWTIYLLWQGNPAAAGDLVQVPTYQFTNQLFDSAGNRYAQDDLPALNGSLWRAGELILTRVELIPTAALPHNKTLMLHVGMYSLPGTTSGQALANARAIDGAGNPVAGWITIPVCARF